MPENLEGFSPTLVEKVTEVIKREEEAGRDPYAWQEAFEASISRTSNTGLRGRFETIFLHCIVSREPVVSSDPPANETIFPTVIIFQKEQELGNNGNGKNHLKGQDGVGNNRQEHLEGLSQLPRAEAVLYQRAQANKRGLLHAQKSGRAKDQNSKPTGRRLT